MPNINRTDDGSQQVKTESLRLSSAVAASAGIAYNLFHAPWPCTLRGVYVAATGLSGAPSANIDILRFNGTGGTTLIAKVGATMTILAYGASSAIQGFSMVATGSTLLAMQAGDVVQWNQQFSGGNVAMGDGVVTVVVQPIQDILTQFGVSYSGT